MCGIAGTMCLNNRKLENAEIIKNMTLQISDRGPDGAGIRIIEQGKIGLAHTRLAIIDLSEKANQPMCDRDESVYIVFNGEIYNHQELRKELDEIKNIAWKTDHSDTEVIIEAYKSWGISCISKFIGMFAFALWDSRCKRMYLVRDRLGVKPLYYSIMDDKINFASNVKALLQDPEQDRTVNKKGIYDFISLLAVPAPNTLFKHIKKLPAGTYMEIGQDGSVKRKKYWDAANYIKRGSRHEEYYIAKLMKCLKQSVNLRKAGDVPIGIFLSGGVDSTTNLALFSHGNENVKTFTVGYKNTKTYRNENEFARQMAERYHAEFFEVLLGEEDILGCLSRFVEFLDDPVADPVIISQYLIAKAARENGIKVIQVGEGSDEMFGGYGYWEEISRLEKINRVVPKPILQIFYKFLKKNGKLSPVDEEVFQRWVSGKAVFWGSRIYVNEKDKRKIFSDDFLKEIGSHETWDNFKECYQKYKRKSRDSMAWMTYVTTRFRLPDLLLARSDKACMAAGVEARVPFLDHRLVQDCMSIPEKYKVKNHTAKYILKQGVSGLIPASVINRKKAGFGLPFFDWYRGELGESIRREIEDFSERSHFFNKTELQKFISQKSQEPFIIWAVYVLALWWRKYA